MGLYEAARHVPGVSGHEPAYTANRLFSIVLLNQAIADLVNAHARLDISQAWGDGTTVAADGTHMGTYLDNLLAETSVRYGKPGSIAYHHIADTYVALFTHFIPCGVWEAVYIIEGLLKNTSEVQPTTVHADTQGQSFPVFALARPGRRQGPGPLARRRPPRTCQRGAGARHWGTRCKSSPTSSAPVSACPAPPKPTCRPVTRTPGPHTWPCARSGTPATASPPALMRRSS
ncbi:Tn3 family transposase [Streptomyces sp. NPDC002722]|uniref:Tn3 family transposase n=1 Tax=Streptomyces sp. NPDC002722 TaxID=3154425 RepID=UPI00331F548E